jgi:hypothetical protein
MPLRAVRANGRRARREKKEELDRAQEKAGEVADLERKT